jgi:hypothetical protein
MGTDFEGGALLAVSLGEEADTTGVGHDQLAGAHSIPERNGDSKPWSWTSSNRSLRASTKRRSRSREPLGSSPAAPA